ncbi:MAG: prenyltransferase/squalene oxidase repeat-containing protein [Candidatus Firestonebacteria bacterium]
MDYEAAFKKIKAELLASAGGESHWTGELSASALSTATAVSAFSLAGGPLDKELIDKGLKWLESNQNYEGGWGDTIKSPCNLPTTMLVTAAFELSGKTAGYEACLGKAEEYLIRKAGKSSSERRTKLYEIYGKDRTFVVPILVNLALAGKVEWKEIPFLPFELAALPAAFYRMINLPVVSYALPALISMGQIIFDKRNSKNILRKITAKITLRKLQAIQPESGGYLEAIPLTAFVVMSLMPLYGLGQPVVVNGLKFLRKAASADGSWPIDSNLSQWLTTQSVQALSVRGGETLNGTKAWLLKNQTQNRHKYTDSAPGAWGWSDLSGSVPDADDTASALLALMELGAKDCREAVDSGAEWLRNLQNSDGGFPTFCKGRLELPFDKSSPDITAHCLRALNAIKGKCSFWSGINRQDGDA